MMFKRFQATDDQPFWNDLQQVSQQINGLYYESHEKFGQKFKGILDQLLGKQSHRGIFHRVYESAMNDSHIEWVPKLDKAMQILSPSQTLIKTLSLRNFSDLVIPIESHYLPAYLKTSNLLTERNSFLNISYSVQGFVTPAIDYLFIRLCCALHQLPFIEGDRSSEEDMKTDDIYFYISRNPFLMKIREYLEHFSSGVTVKLNFCQRLVGIIKMFFVNELLLKDRIDSRSTFRRFSMSSSYKIRPQTFLVLFLLIWRGGAYFQQKYSYLTEVTKNFNQLLQTENEIFLRFLIRLYLFAFNPKGIECQVVDELSKANQTTGYFEVQRYTVRDFVARSNQLPKKEALEFDESKSHLMPLFENKNNYLKRGRLTVGMIVSIGCLLAFSDKVLGEERNIHKAENESQTLQKVLRKVMRFFEEMRSNSKSKTMQVSSQNYEDMVTRMRENYEHMYRRKLNLAKSSGIGQSRDGNRGFLGADDDDDEQFMFSIRNYELRRKYSCWEVPIKESQFEILYDFFYWLARKIDRLIPGHQNRQKPLLNLRYFCNPLFLLFFLIVVVVGLKILF